MKMKLKNEDRERYRKLSTGELIETLRVFCHNDYSTEYQRQASDFIAYLIRERLIKGKK